MVGMVSSIFGQTTQELQKKRDAELKAKKNKMLSMVSSPEEAFGVSLGSSLGNRLTTGLFDAFGLDKEMETARQAEEQQAALDEQLSALPRNDPRRFYLYSDAYYKRGDTARATEYLRLGQQLESQQNKLKRQQAEKDAEKAAELEKRRVLSETYTDKKAQKMALAGYSVTDIEKVTGTKKPKAYVAEATKDDIEQVSSFLAMNDLNFGDETQPVVVRMVAEDLSRLKNDYSKAFEEGDVEKPWMGDTQAINSLLAEYQAKGYITNEPSTFGVGGGLRFNPMDQNRQNNQNRTNNTPPPQSAVDETFPEGLPTNNNNVASPKQTEASLGTLGDIIGIPNKDEINKFKEDYFTPNWQNYLNK